MLRLQPPVAWERRGAARPTGPSLSLDGLYLAARRAVGAPLAESAARALLSRVNRGGRVVLTTGLVTPHVPRGETDGPSGTLALARALILGLRASVLIVSEPQVVPVLSAGAAALAASERDGGAWQSRVRIRPFPSDPAQAAAAACRVRRLGPDALISIEKLGPNPRGIIHTMRGEDVTRQQARTDLLFSPATRRGPLTVGIGDRGNEIGMGGLLARPARCACPCRGTIACAVPARFPVAAFTSNWGAYALIAALAAYCGQPRLLPRPETEGRMLRRMVGAGAVDGATRERVPTVDGTGIELQAAFLAMLHALVEAAPQP